MGSIITTKKGLLKLVKGQIEVEVNGSNQPAKDGEQLPKGAVLHIGENATYEITFDDGTKLSNEVEPSIAATPNAGGQATQDEIQALQDLIASGEDPTQNLPETAAGNAPAGRDGNSGYVTLARDGTEALATSGYSTSGQTLTAATTAAPEQTLATDSPSVLVNDSITVDEDTVASGNVLDNDSDADNVLSVVGFNINGTDFAAGTVVTLEGGSFILNADGSYSFTPNENWNGQVPVITYTTDTGSTATLTINVTPVDDPSVLANDTNTVAEDTVATGNVLDNDTDVDSSLSVVSFTVSGSTFAAGTTVALEGGSLLLNADGSYSFTPNENWNGQVPVITYTTNTGSTATLTINVTPVDDPSVLANDTNTVDEDTVATGNVLDNDTDVDSSLSVVSFTVSGSTFAAGTTVALEGGSLVLNADGSYSFTPNENWNGQVPVITYTTNTGSTATLTINVTPVDDPSVLANDTNTVAEDTVATGNVLDNDTDVDSSLSVVSFTVSGSTFAAGTTVALEGGSLVLNADGSYSFTPNADWNGQVPVITYTTNTGSTATLTINVTPVADGAPSVTITTDTNDDGFISNAELGGATDVSVTIGLDGTGANAGDTLTVNGVDYVLTQEDINNGYVNLTLPAPAEGETITVVATITDPAGNTSPEGSDSALLDTTAPTITVSAPDDTRDTTPTITGTTDAAPGSVITIVVTDSNGVQQTLTTTVNPDGTYAVDVINPIPHGGYTATATVTDPAGNTGNATDNGNVDIKIDEDGDGNTVAITAITQDTGSSSSDFITNDNTLIFKGTVDLGDNSTLAVTINGVVYTTANGLVIDAQGNWSVDLTGTVLPDGTYPVSATVTDVAGNSKTVTQDVVIDTKIDQDGDGNTVAITAITQDTGSSSSDFITNDNTLIFKGTVDLGDNSTLAVTINGVVYTTANGLVIDAQGNWSVDLTGTVLPDGTYPVSATVTDVAGNSKTVTQDVVIDTKIDQDGDGNTVAITAITQDTGSSSSDFITNDNTLIFKGTVDLGDNSTLAVTINGVVYTTANGLVIDAQGNWSVDLTGTVLPDGTYPVSATVTDVAGNSKTVTQDVVIDTKIDQDGDGNTVAITAITQDTGSSSSDFITNDNTLIFKGTVDLGDNSTLAVTINGVVYTTANGLVIDAQGNWSVDLTGTVLPDGTYPVSATVTDVAGNSKTVTQDVVIDTKIDQDGDGNTVAITAITQDTGSSSSDFITNDNTLIFKGTVDLGDNSTLAVTINGVVYTTANGLVIDAQGNWSVDLTGTVLPDGTYPVSATVTDVAGNSKTVTQDVVIDTKIDQDGDGNTVAITAITQDTGSSSSDFITNDNTLIFKGTVDLGDNSTLAVTINGVVYTTANGLVIDAQGNWSVDLTGTVLPDGTYPVSATVTDVAGNSKTVTQDVVIDTKIDQDGDGNTVAITAITQDTGSSSSDFITNDNTLIFKGTVDLGDNSTLAVTINGVVYTTANGLVIDAQGNWSVDLTGTVLPDGTYPVSATVTDVAGNSKTVTQDVVIDTKIDQDGDGNTVAITAITQDTGSSSSDFITNDNTLIFKGTVDLGDNSTLAVTINGVVYTTANGLVIDAQGNWSVDLTGTVLPDGTYPVSATVTDVAGNSKTVTQDVVIDTKIDQDGDGNTVAITAITQDTGSSSSDFITNDNTLIFKGTVDLGDNSTLAVTINGVVYTTANGLVIDAQGNWSVDLTGTVLPDGTYPVSATVTDVAGNSKTVTQDVVIDTKIDQDGDGNTVAITAITQDTGSSSSDFITNDNTLIFKGTVDLGDNSTLAVTINGVVYTTANGLVIDAQGNWSVDLTGTVLPDGTYPVSATVTDVAGNSKTVTQDVVIDTKIDQDGDGNTVAITAITQDTGSSSSDFITNDNTLIFKGTVDLGDNSTLAVTINGVVYTTANGLVIDAQGNWSVDLTGTVLPDGTYPVSATVTDVAGNSKTVTQDVVIDTKIDQDGDGNTVAITAITQDTGSSSSDFITNDNTLIFKGTVDLGDNSTLAVTINGVVYTTANGLVIDAQGNWSVDLTGTVLPDGTYPVSATVTDVAGNSKTVTQDVVIDTKIDQDGDGNTVAITAITQDTGSSSSDFITNDNTLIFKGTVDLGDNSTLAVTINGVVYTTANGLVIDAQGNWSVDLTGTVLPDGTYPVSATVTDVAGNSKTVTQDVVIDTKIDQDGDGNTVAITAITQDTGSSSSDFITNDNTLIFKGTVDLGDNSTLAVTINGVVYTTANGLVIDAQGNWSVDLTGTVLPDGTYPVSATVTDVAGNSKTVTQDVVIDTKIDQDGDGNTVAITAITQDTGSSSSDFITNDNTLIFKGTVDLGDNSTLAVTINGVVYTTANGLVIDAQGNWSVDLTGTVLPDGTYPVSATVTDVAGNSKTVTQDVVIDTKIDQDGDGNTVAITAITQDTGSSSSDFITNDNTLIFKGTVDLGDNSTLAVTINGVVYTTANGLVIDAQGNWSVDLTGTVLPDGTYPVSATVTDVAGNSKTVTQDVVIDTKIDQDGDGNTVAITAITQDTGSSSSDFITNDNTLIFKGTVDLGDNSTLAVTINGVVYTTANGLVIDAQGNWSVDLTGTVLPDGTYPVSATVTDVAGNSKTVTQDVVIDTKIDQDGDGNTVAITAITQDTGSSSSDFITNDNTLIFKGTVDLGDNSTLAVTINGVVYTTANGLVIDAQGNWSVDLTGTVLPDGTYPVSATVTDVAGNSKTVTQDVVIDTKIDQDGDGNTVAITAITQDTGSSSSDFITNDNTLIFKGTVDLGDNSTLAVTINGVVYTTANGLVIDAQGNWSVDLTGTVLPDGTYPVSATVTDVAGNSKTVTQDVVIDTKIDQDGDGNTVAITAITQDTGSSSSDFITNDNTLIFKGTVDLGDNSTLAVTINGVVYTTANGLVIDAQGNWSVDLTGTVLPDGTYPVSATVTDVAGNSKTVTQDVVIDTQSAAAPTVTIDEDLNNDGFINPTELTGPVNITVTVGLGTSIGDLLIVTDQAGNTLFYGLVTQEILNNGLQLGIIAPAIGTNLVITAVVTDQAGNSTSGQDQARLTDSADDSKTVVEDTVASGNVLTNDEAGNTSVVSFTVAGSSVVHNAGSSVVLTGGTLVLNSNGSYSFTPNANWNGAVPVITYTTNTGAIATLTITVTPDNTDAANDSKTVVEDTVASGNVLTNDEAGNTSVVSFTVAGSSVVHNAGSSVVLTGGTLVLNSNGSYSFTPNANWNGAVPVITYTTNTGAIATLTITVTPDNTDAANDSKTVVEDTVASGNVLTNDEAGNTSVVSFTVAGSSVVHNAGSSVVLTGGTLVLNSNGSYSFTPNANWNGAVPVITYTTNTGAIATLTITVTPDNTDAANDSKTVVEDTVASGNVLTNDEAGNTSVVSFTVAGSSVVHNAGSSVVLTGGTLVLNSNGSYSFTPNANWNGAVPVITYTTNTGAIATLTITVTPDNTDAANDSKTVVEDTVASGNVLTNDEAGNTSVVSFTVAGSSVVHNAGSSVVLTGGTLVLNSNGSYSFTPNANWNGAVPVITYTTNTGAIATLTITVTPADDPVTIINTVGPLNVYESALANGTGNPSTGQTSAQGSMSITANDGLNRIEVTNSVGITSTLTLATLLSASLTSPIVIAGANGTLYITGYSNGQLQYTYTLTHAQTHSTQGSDTLNDNFQVKAIDTDGDFATTTITTTVHDDVATAHNDTDQLEVVLDSFNFSGIVANWTTINGGSDVRKFDGPDNDSGKDQVRWGDPASYNGSQSGYGFADNDAALNGSLSLNQDIVLGTFTHYNYPIDSGTSITSATMQITFNVTDAYGVTTPVTLTLNFSHNETPNDGPDPRDIVTVGQTSVTFNYEGQVYTMQVIGFKDSNGNIVTSIYTNENDATSYQLVVRMVAGNGYTLPHTDGNVLTNDTTGADTAVTVIGVANGDHTNTGVSGHVGTTINGLYGTLILYADGTYHYQLTASADLIPASGATETFTYTMQDGDGDRSSATLKINVSPVNADGVNLVDANAFTTQGSSLNDTIVVTNGENSSSHNRLNVTFGGGLSGIITNSSEQKIVSSGANKKSYSTTDAQIVSGGDGNDHIETGRGDDVIYAGKTGAIGYGTDDQLELSVNALSTHHIMTGTLSGTNSIVDNDGLLLANDVASQRADVVNGGSGDDRIYGQSGSDILYGHTGNDYIDGGSHNDALRGGEGNDTLIGGLGDDVLRGDNGADTFVWRYADADKGTDHIMDFKVGEDKLDLSDLLQGETANTLESYLSFSLNNGSTVIDIDANKDGTFDQHIVLDGVNLYSQFGATDNAGIINGLLGSNGNGPLIIDTAPPVTPDAPQGVTPLTDPHNNIIP
ncbi:Ig-like domain-containing protein [Shewanella sp. Koi 1]